jgi:hypothetical protein
MSTSFTISWPLAQAVQPGDIVVMRKGLQPALRTIYADTRFRSCDILGRCREDDVFIVVSKAGTTLFVAGYIIGYVSLYDELCHVL